MIDSFLDQLQVVVVDCQTTHSSPQKGRVIEIAWSQTHASQDLRMPEVEQYLIQWPDEIELSTRIQKLTGIDPNELKQAHTIQSVGHRFCEVVSSGPPLVIHHAAFEMPFLEQVFEAHYGIATPYPHAIVCTRILARKLWPGLPRCSLRALAGFLGHEIMHQKRARTHVLATIHIWREIVEKLRVEHNIQTWGDVHDWLMHTHTTKPTRHTFAIEATERLALPEGPGVYRFFNQRNEVLYVGKATSLKQRVNSYFRGKKRNDEKLLELITQIHQVDCTETETPLEAALLESDEIKKFAPRYNIALQTGERRIGFADRNLSVITDSRDSNTLWGPFIQNRSVESLVRINSVLRNLIRLDEDFASQLFWVAHGTSLDLQVVNTGFDLWRQQHASYLETRKHGAGLVWLGQHLAHIQESESQQQNLDTEDQTDETSVSKAPFEWTPESIAHALNCIVLDGTYQLRLSRWLWILTECVCIWSTHTTHEAHRFLLISQGKIIDRGYLEGRTEIPHAHGLTSTRTERQAHINLETFDRMRVLFSELKRIAVEKNSLELIFKNSQVSNRKALQKALLRF